MMNVREVYGMTKVELALKLMQADKERVFVAVQVAPAVRVLVGEKFGLARGEDALGKVSAALRLLGADAVTDTAIAQDILTLQRVEAVKMKKEKGGAPVLVGMGAEKISPLEIHARLLKKYYGEKFPEKSVRVVAVACHEQAAVNMPAADVVLTVDELAELLSVANCNLRLLKKACVDTPFGVASGSAYICATAGGKAEAVARCLMVNKSRSAVQKLAYSGLYGSKGLREGVITACGTDWRLAVVACRESAQRVVEEIERGVCEYDLVEFTKGGCIRGGLDCSAESAMTLRMRGLGLRYLDRGHAARSADMTSYAAVALKEWEEMVRSGEAFAEIAAISEDELVPAPVVIEEEPIIIEEEIVEEVVEAVEETPVEEVVEAVEETPVEEVVEAVEETPVEEVVEIVEETPVEEVVEVVEETPVEEVVEVVEETPVEEVVEAVEETPVEEVVEAVEETPVEEVVEVVEETPVEEVVEVVEETPVEEVVEAVEETPVEEVVEVVEETPVEEVVEVVEETPVEEVVEAVEETPVEEVVEVVEETPVEEVEIIEEIAVTESVVEEAPEEEDSEVIAEAPAEIEEAPVEEVVEESPAEETPVEAENGEGRNPYYVRMSSKDRRKMKRKNKK